LFHSTVFHFVMNIRIVFSLCAFTVAFCAVLATQSVTAQTNAGSAAHQRVSFQVIIQDIAGRGVHHNARSVQDKHNAVVTAADTMPVLLLRERTTSLFLRDTAFQKGTVAIVRIGGDLQTSMTIAYSLEYLDSAMNPLPNVGVEVLNLPAPLPDGVTATPPYPAPVPVAINGLQGDLSPTITNENGQIVAVNLASASSPNTAIIQSGQERVVINFTARWGDQIFSPQFAGLQGRRMVRLTLLRVNGVSYDIGVTFATVILEDPKGIQPVVVNAIQNKQALSNGSDLIELETPGFRSDGRLNAVFYDANYNTLIYTATSSDSAVVSVEAIQRDSRLSGRPSLFYAVRPGAPLNSTTAITVVAADGTGLLARTTFIVEVVGTITSVQSAPTAGFRLFPNPTADRVTVEVAAESSQQTGQVQMRVFDILGQVVATFSGEQPVTVGPVCRYTVDVASLPVGVYMVEVQYGTQRSVHAVMKQ
jgi:hypothetical protein